MATLLQAIATYISMSAHVEMLTCNYTYYILNASCQHRCADMSCRQPILLISQLLHNLILMQFISS